MTTDMSIKKAKLEEDGCIEDRISNLPDVILSHILSFASTRDAVRTSTLSTRWNSVWTSVPTLNFDGFNVHDMLFKYDDTVRAKLQSSFANFLDKVFLDQKMPYIETITIRGGPRYDASRVKSWICAAVNRNVREIVLDVDTNIKSIDELPQALFGSNKLVVLKLHVNMTLNVPANRVCFPNLKVLELRKLIYKDDDSARNLISSCPVLEDLAITRGHSDNLVTLNVNSRVLKNLKVSCRDSNGDLERKLVIDTSALESIDIFDCVTDEYEVVSDLSSITKAKLHISNSFSVSQDSESFEMCLIELLGKIPNVKFLSFSSYTMVSLSDSETYDLPNFQYLTCFELYARTKVKRISWGLMMEILFCSPALENLIFSGFEFSWDGKEEVCHCDVPKCLSTNLKTIKIMGLIRSYDLRKLSYFLENALVLEKITIDNVMWREDFKLEVGKKLSKMRKASMACQIHFC